jgi:hypothetical protein
MWCRQPGRDPDTTDYGYEFVSAVQLGNIVATQFHPEKSGPAGLALLENFLAATGKSTLSPGAARKKRPWPNASSPVWMSAPTTGATWW